MFLNLLRASTQLAFSRHVDMLGPGCVMLRRELYMQIAAAEGLLRNQESSLVASADLALAVAARNYTIIFQPTAVVSYGRLLQIGGTAAPTYQLQRLLCAGVLRRNKDIRPGKAACTARVAVPAAQVEQEPGRWVPAHFVVWCRLCSFMCVANYENPAATCPVAVKHCPNSTHASVAALRLGSPRVLWIEDGVPEPDRDSGSVRSAWLLRLLADEGYSVTFQPRVFKKAHAYTQHLRFHGVRVLPLLEPGAPVAVEHAGRCFYDGFVISRPDGFEQFGASIKAACPSAPLLFDTVDVHFLREARAALSEGETFAGSAPVGLQLGGASGSYSATDACSVDPALHRRSRQAVQQLGPGQGRARQDT